MFRPRCRVAFGFVALLLALLSGSLAAQNQAPERASGWAEKKAVSAQRFMVAAANPLAVDAGYAMLKEGGSAVDAAIAVQMVLNLVEPQSSGIGGGAFMLHHRAHDHKLVAYDGRETAPAAAKPDRFIGSDGKPQKFYDAVIGGKSVGVPGTLRMLELAHREQGKLPWARLFEPAIRLAEDGFVVSPRLASALKGDKFLSLNGAARSYFFHADGSALAAGERRKNPEFAAVLQRIAKEGASALYEGELARDIVAAVKAHPVNPGDMTEADLASYRAKKRLPVCGHYRVYTVCGMPPPSSGGITVLQILGLLERFDMPSIAPGSLFAAHLFSEAGRLAYADRNRYLADPDFVPPPEGLTDPAYLAERSQLIHVDRALGRAQPGEPYSLRMQKAALADGDALEFPSTSHISIVDAAGNALAMTTTIEDGFGSRMMVHGFLLNNELTDFSFTATEDGKSVANSVQAGKRPRSSMAPTIVYDRQGKIKMITGSPGGSAIINYVAKTLIGVLDWQLDAQSAIDLPNMGSRNAATELEENTAVATLGEKLRALGHEVKVMEFNSGVQSIVRVGNRWVGGADPRREGIAKGD